MASPSFSIVIPTYNRAGSIRPTIASALAQRYDDYEVIVVDDGSTDATEAVVTGMNDRRLRYFKRPNAERGATRNYGRSQARGEYVNFFDSDDALYPGHLEEAARMVREHGSPEAFHLGFDEKTPAGALVRVERFEGNLDEVLGSRGNILSCNGVFLRRDVAERHPFNEDRALSGSEDYELWLRLAARYRVPCSSAVTSTVIAHPDRSTVATTRERVLGRLAAFKAHAFNDPEVLRRFGAVRDRIELEMESYTALYLSLCGHRADSLTFLARIVIRRPQFLFTKRFAATVKHLIR